jgi:folate-binding protein YgfZ
MTMIQLPYLSSARFSGSDVGSFLHSQLSADIAALDEGASTFAAYCTPRGQVLGLLLVGRLEDSYWVVGSSELLPAIIQRLRMFVLRADVQVEILQELQVFGLQPSCTAGTAAAIFSPGGCSLRYILDVKSAASSEEVGWWKCAELSQGISWLGPETTEKFIPQMLGFDDIGAVSFSKGCYPGQEIVARARYLGKVKRKPLVVAVAGQARIVNRSKVQVIYKSESIDGLLVDSAPAENGNTLLFIVTRPSDGGQAESISFEGQSYRLVDM